MKNGIKGFFNIILRIVAVFTAQALSVIGAGAVAGVSTVKAMMVAGITAVATAVDSKATTAADLQVEAKQNGQVIVIKSDGTTSRVAPAINGIPADVAVAATGEVPIPANADKDPDYN